MRVQPARGRVGPLIAIQGERGAYSDEAAERLHGAAKRLPCRTFHDAFRALAEGRATAAVLPVENTTTGSVYQAEDLLYEHAATAQARAETVLPIAHALIAKPGTRIEDLKRVYSHPQALAQCERFVRERGFETEPVWDTAGAVKWLRDSGAPDAGALASPFAAKLHGMAVLAESVQDEPGNMTRFLSIEAAGASPPAVDSDTTSLAFVTQHKPGALHEALGALAARSVNLLRLHSRPVRGRAWEYAFFADVEAHPASAVLAEALRDLAGHCRDVRVLGGFRRAR